VQRVARPPFFFFFFFFFLLTSAGCQLLRQTGIFQCNPTLASLSLEDDLPGRLASVT
jgi:hypothetical protein